MKDARSTDVVIVGGGPAGLASAIAARNHGLEVTVLEAGSGVLDKACGEGLMPDGIAALARLGVATEDLGVPFGGIRYIDERSEARGSFPASPGRGIRRTALHQRLRREARARKVQLIEGQRVTAIELPQPSADGWVEADERWRCRWIVGADGLRSNVRRWAKLGAATPNREHRRLGLRRHFHCAPWSREVEVYWADGVEAYVTPVAPHEIGVAFLWHGKGATFDRLLDRVPRLRERLAQAPHSSESRGAGPLAQPVTAATRGQLALVGDAAGYLDAITGEGLSMAFLQAEALGAALGAGSLERYNRASRALHRLPDLLIRLLLTIERRPFLRRRLVATLARQPELFDRLLAVHTRDRPPSHIGVSGAIKLTSGLLFPS